MVPNFVLKRLYLKESLCNTTRGCQFTLQNSLGAGTVARFQGLEIDGTPVPLDQLFRVEPTGAFQPVQAITPEAPLPLADGASYTLLLQEVWLEPGKHTLHLSIESVDLGPWDFSVKDTVREERDAVVEPRPVSQGVTRSDWESRPVKVVILGAGSTVFARQLMTDLLCTPGLERGRFALVDVDRERLDLAHRMGQALVERSGRAWQVEATADRTQALPDCDYVINTIEVAGLRNVRPDYEIPLKYGVDQCIGDTIGPGGIFKMLRTGPVWLDIVRDIERLCPQALVMNYSNPMSALTLLALRATQLQVVGLCHSVQGTSSQLAAYLDVPQADLQFCCAGINHMAWFTQLRYQGQDMYPRLFELAQDPEIYEADPVRFEVMLHFGAFVTESSGHFSEYVPYFRKRPDLVARYMRPGYRGESGFYARNWPRWRAQADDTVRAQLEGAREIALERGSEYASVIVEAIESGCPVVIYGNVRNQGLIDNLPAEGCVEVPILVDANGLHATHFGSLPVQLAALNAAHMYVHELMVKAILERDRGAACQALMLDPLTAAVCSPEEIERMFEEMWQAERADLAAFEG
jgi:alpha-galactosidase